MTSSAPGAFFAEEIIATLGCYGAPSGVQGPASRPIMAAPLPAYRNGSISPVRRPSTTPPRRPVAVARTEGSDFDRRARQPTPTCIGTNGFSKTPLYPHSAGRAPTPVFRRSAMRRLLVGRAPERRLRTALRARRDSRARQLRKRGGFDHNSSGPLDNSAPATAKHFNGTPSMAHWPTDIGANGSRSDKLQSRPLWAQPIAPNRCLPCRANAQAGEEFVDYQRTRKPRLASRCSKSVPSRSLPIDTTPNRLTR